MNLMLNLADVASLLLQICGVAFLLMLLVYGLLRYAAARDAEREARGEAVERSLAGLSFWRP